ncbi:MAG TPA: AAA family ATPase [Vicinamibacterales bacterium]|nr:AAA family ATPase [Vicinamibacterales bacterium]
MYESYYGFAEKPFSLTPDPKYLYRSESHANAFDLLQYAIRRREGFVVVTGDIGTGKTTLCRAVLETIDRTTFTALVLNPFLTEEDLLKRILQDFGVISRDEVKAGALARVTKQELIDALYEFLLSLVPLKASAVMIIDEAQNLPLRVLEQIRILSNLETDKEKLLQIILVGQLDLQTLLRSPELRQLDQRVSIRYELKPLDADAVAAYVAHRLTIAGGNASVTFTRQALRQVHRWSGGIPRLINLICDRALIAAFSIRSNRVSGDMVTHAARGLEIEKPQPRAIRWLTPRASMLTAAAIVLFAATFAVLATAFLYQRFDARVSAAARPAPAAAQRFIGHRLPADAALTILVSSYPVGDASTPRDVDALSRWLDASGFAVFHAEVDLGSRGRWHRVLAGTYTDVDAARRDTERLKATVPGSDPQLLTGATARGLAAAAREPADAARPTLEP